MIAAARLALASGEPERAAALLRRHWLRLILESHTHELEQLCVEFPDAHDPHLLLIRACCRDLAGDANGATFLRGQGLRLAPDDFVVCFTTLLLAPDAPSKTEIADRARRALAECGPEDDYPSALFLLGWTEIRLRRNLPEAISLLRSASDEARLQARAATLRLAQANLAFALTHAGAFTEAEAILDRLPESAQPSDWDLFEGGLPESTRGTIAFWRGDFEAAVVHCDAIVNRASPGTNFEAQARLYLTLSLIALGRRDRFREAGELVQGVSTADKHGIPWGVLRRVTSAWLAYAEGQDEHALRLGTPALTRSGAPVAHALLAELFQRLGAHELAQQALRLVTVATPPRYARVSALVTSAGLRSAAGRGELAHETLASALEAAEPERVLAPFLTPDETIGDLLSAHAKRGSPHDAFLRTIFAQRDRRFPGTAELLTHREREILACLRTTMTGEEIAAHLGISYPTVKTHIRSIYRKLGVSSRRAAIHARDARGR
ncbi:LuxR C-terminal-related transcriptional regulator [Leucobacter sp. M11]|uniref:LuxR C-terminal-related transcriptional regulator n=1 Tax=Leucobacter sp. M11 TaxID=2993565 RepID=UPI002D7E2F89|nr:LuxR C-terminal-related transcriptional regulator [Leucobacter sp. M11]MEB4614929.1 LuxR C-terminal-related transcriptional regulator [Leucobacter sp. M11]